MKRGKFISAALSFVAFGMIWILWGHCLRGGSGERGQLTLYCAATFRKPVEQVATAFRKQLGEDLAIRFGGSGELAAQLAIAGGDLFLPADESYLDLLDERGLLGARIPLCELFPGIIVPIGNPRRIDGIDGLASRGVRVALCDRSAAIGLHMDRWLGRDERWRRVVAGSVVSMGTVTEVAQAVSLGVVDAGVVWDVVARQFEGIDFVKFNEPGLPPALGSIGVLKSSVEKEAAVRCFLDLLTRRRDQGDLFAGCGRERSSLHGAVTSLISR